MTREETIDILENEKMCVNNETCQREECATCSLVMDKDKILTALDMALTALRPVSREQVEKVWSGCPYCKEDGEGYVQKFGAYSIQNGELATGHCKSQKIKFCPHCSCPLTDEAVEMVLTRLNELSDRLLASTSIAP